MDEVVAAERRFTRAFYAFQFFYGGWFLFHGLNWWLRYFPERSFAPDARGLIPELIRTGLFDLVKLLEMLIGLALLADLFAALAIAAAFPITVVIAWVNASKGSAFGISVATVIVALNALMAIGRLDRYLPMLALHAGRPGASGLRASHGRSVMRPASYRLPLGRHVVAVLLGIAVPAGLTYASIYLAGPAPAASTKARP